LGDFIGGDLGFVRSRIPALTAGAPYRRDHHARQEYDEKEDENESRAGYAGRG